MSVFTNLRTDILKMYEYKETISQLDIKVPSHIEVQLDNLPLDKPYMPRIDSRQAHMFLWLGKKEDDIETYNLAENCKSEIMWVDNKTPNTYIKGVGMFHIYDDYVVVGSLKYAGYLQRKTPADRRHLIRTMWCETINIFKLVETINVEFLKIQFNSQSKFQLKNYVIDLNSREMLVNNKMTNSKFNFLSLEIKVAFF